MEWVTKHKVKLTNIFCKDWEPTRAKTNKLKFWEQDETQLQKWKILDHIAVTIWWKEARSQEIAELQTLQITGRW